MVSVPAPPPPSPGPASSDPTAAGEVPVEPASTDPVHADGDYRSATLGWISYSWASAAFASVVVVLAAPRWLGSVAGITLPSSARALQLLANSVVVVTVLTALVAPFLGVVADVHAWRRRTLGLVVVAGSAATGALALATEGRWVLALVLVGLARMAFQVGTVLQDGLLAEVARPDDRAAISAGGQAAGELAGGLLLALALGVSLVMPHEVVLRWAFVAVAVWWMLFTIPLLRRVPEPGPGGVGRWGRRRGRARRNIREVVGIVAGRPDLVRVLVASALSREAMLAIGLLAGLYAGQLGFGPGAVVGVAVLVALAGAPHTVAFGRLVTPGSVGRGSILAFLVASLVLLPVTAITLALQAPSELVGRVDHEFQQRGIRVGQGSVLLGARGTDQARPTQVEPRVLAADEPVPALVVEGRWSLGYRGRDVRIEHGRGPDGGTLRVLVDDRAVIDGQGQPVVVDTRDDRRRFGSAVVVPVPEPGPHDLALVVEGGPVTVTAVEVLPPRRLVAWWLVAAVIGGVVVASLAIAGLVGRRLDPWAADLDERHGVILALGGFGAIAVWGARVDTTLEVWVLAWMVAVVLGGARSLLRSLYASWIPPGRGSGFFGLHITLLALTALVPATLFAVSGALWDSPRPAVLLLGLVFALAAALVRGTTVGPRGSGSSKMAPDRGPVTRDGGPAAAPAGPAERTPSPLGRQAGPIA